ncbi:MAG: hypothetical protein HLX52_04650 [Idiomarinaceae bacterium]|nr:hypothetical protein [Idiomarina sp. 28-8]NWO02237.1 hypothetical protein [Idiomarinaceae bacterium]
MSEAELSEYCGTKGLYIDQVKAWKTESLKGFVSLKNREQETRQQRKADH